MERGKGGGREGERGGKVSKYCVTIGSIQEQQC